MELPGTGKAQKWLGIVVMTLITIPAVFAGLWIGKRTVLAPLLNGMKHEPAATDLAGCYVSEKTAGHPARICLKADRSMTVSDVMGVGFGGEMDCMWDGSGQWIVSGPSLSLKIVDRSGAVETDCPGDWVNFGFDVQGEGPPYRLYMPIGNRNEGVGVTFVKQKGQGNRSME